MNKPWLLVFCVFLGCARAKPAERPHAAPEQAASGAGPALALGATPEAQSDQVERVFALPRQSQAPKLGRDDAKVWLEVCSDFECPFCAQLAPTLHELVENYGEL